jgi:hypothetical protein
MLLVGKPKSVILDIKHYRKVRKLAKSSHMKIYELLHIIIDGHFERMERLEELRKENRNDLIEKPVA